MTQKRKILAYIIVSILAGLFGYFVYKNRMKLGRILTPFFIAVVIAYLLRPLVEKLKRKNIPCSVSIILIYTFFTFLILALVIYVIPELIDNTKELMTILPDISARYETFLDGFFSAIQSSRWSPEIKETIFMEMQRMSILTQGYIMDALRKALTVLVVTITMMADFVVALIIAYYLIKDAELFKETMLSLVPRRWRSWIINTSREINGILSNFIQGQVLVAVVIGILETIGLFIVRAKYPLVLGLIGGVANIIPYFGPIIGAIPAIGISLIESPAKALWVSLVFIVVQQIDNAFVSPKIIEGRLGLHPVTTILAVLAGGEFFGIMGMLLSVPVVAVVKAILKRAVEAIV